MKHITTNVSTFQRSQLAAVGLLSSHYFYTSYQRFKRVQLTPVKLSSLIEIVMNLAPIKIFGETFCLFFCYVCVRVNVIKMYMFENGKYLHRST